MTTEPATQETKIAPHTVGAHTFDAVYVATYGVEALASGVWLVRSMHQTIPGAQTEARRRVRLFGDKKEAVRIRRWWHPVRAA